jgi:hypothetical protein
MVENENEEYSDEQKDASKKYNEFKNHDDYEIDVDGVFDDDNDEDHWES